MFEPEFRTFSLFPYMTIALPYLSPKPTSQPTTEPSDDATSHTYTLSQGHPGHSSHICWGCLLASRVRDYPADPELNNCVGAWRDLRIEMGHYRKLVYSREEYLQHFRWCRLAQERWEATIKNRDLRTGEEVVPEEYVTEALEDMFSGGW